MFVLPWCIGKRGNQFSGMTSTWDTYTFCFNQMRKVRKDNAVFTFTVAMVVFKIYCYVVDATFSGKTPMLQGKIL